MKLSEVKANELLRWLLEAWLDPDFAGRVPPITLHVLPTHWELRMDGKEPFRFWPEGEDTP